MPRLELYDSEVEWSTLFIKLVLFWFVFVFRLLKLELKFKLLLFKKLYLEYVISGARYSYWSDFFIVVIFW